MLAQQRFGSVKYNVTLIEKKESKLRKMILESFPNAEENIKKLTFLLKFNDNHSVFELKDEQIFSIQETETYKVMAGYLGKYWNLESIVYKLKEENIAYKKCIIKIDKKYDWQILTDVKEINGYKCYKATTEIDIINSRGNFKETIYAWFCPELPYSFGPLEYYGLPGLIFELQTKNAIYGVKEINFKDEVEIDKMPNVEIISKSDYDTLSKKGLKEFFNQK